jgi:hypothetical protein
MKTEKLNNNELLNINGGAAERTLGVTGTISTDNLLSLSAKSTKGNDYHQGSFTVGNGFSLSLLGLKSNHNEY